MELEMKIKNIDELNTLVEKMKSTIDKLQNFSFDIEINQCEHNQEKQN